ncbi:MAG: 2'-5' RNA ligase family protein [Pseudomonadota bacterium]
MTDLPPPAERTGAAPFIVTAELPADLFAWADALRRAHFPPERNHLSAHVTLFHAFAPSLREELRPLLARICAQHAPPRARISGLMNLGRGTAIALDSPDMLAIRAAIADHFHGALTAQDTHPPRLHVTVQNKVTAAEASTLQRELATSIPQRSFAFAGLGLHLYRGGPWEAVAKWKFRGKE